jgi:hypothetical protein
MLDSARGAGQIGGVRLVLAAVFAVYVAVVAAMPHGHGEHHDRSECVACTTARSLEWTPPGLDVAPRLLVFPGGLEIAPESALSDGPPLGAIPGQSPPAV